MKWLDASEKLPRITGLQPIATSFYAIMACVFSLKNVPNKHSSCCWSCALTSDKIRIHARVLNCVFPQVEHQLKLPSRWLRSICSRSHTSRLKWRNLTICETTWNRRSKCSSLPWTAKTRYWRDARNRIAPCWPKSSTTSQKDTTSLKPKLVRRKMLLTLVRKGLMSFKRGVDLSFYPYTVS